MKKLLLIFMNVITFGCLLFSIDMPMTIQEVTVNDPALEQLIEQVVIIQLDAHQKTILPMLRKHCPAEVFELNQLEQKKILRAQLKTGFFKLFVAMQNNEQQEIAIGYILLIPVIDNDEVEQLIDHISNGKREALSEQEKALIQQHLNSAQLYLDTLAVHSSAQGYGVGSMLLNHALTWTKQAGFNSCILGCYQENEPACCFYEKAGFTKIAVKENSNDMGQTIHECIFEKSL